MTRPSPFVDASGRPQAAPLAQKAVTPYRHCCAVSGSGAGGRGSLRRTSQVAAYGGLCLDDGFTTHHDVLGADESCFPSHLVPGLLAWGVTAQPDRGLGSLT